MAPTPSFIHVPDPDFPGWHTWQPEDTTRFNTHGLGRMIVRREGENSACLRLVDVEDRHSNSHGNVHGGLTLALIDVAMFASLYITKGRDVVGSVTLDLHNQFIGAGRIGQPLDVISEVLKETRRLAFVRGTVEQGDHLVANFMGTLRKPSTR